MAKKKRKTATKSRRRVRRVVKELECQKCWYRWIPRGRNPPKRCPDCRKTTWTQRE